MYGRVVVLLTVLCLAFADVEDHAGNFQGTYVFPDGTPMYICQTGTSFQGSYAELGIFRGGVEDEDSTTATGSYWAAGEGPCVLGAFDITLTDFGISGLKGCNGASAKVPFYVNRIDSFRPSDKQCGLISETKETLEGYWENNDGLGLNLCFKSSGATDETVVASLKRVDANGDIVNWYLDGHWVDNGRIFLGTYYQDLAAGAVLFWLSNTGEVNYYWWTGLLRDGGETYIDANQFLNPQKHGVASYHLPLGSHTTDSASCASYEILKNFVLTNLPRDDDDNYYYFVDTEYLAVILYHPTTEFFLSSDATSFISVSLLTIVSLIALL